MGLWTLGKVCAMVSAVKCVNLAIHRPVPLGLIIHYMFKKNFKKNPHMRMLSRVPHLIGLTCGLRISFVTNT